MRFYLGVWMILFVLLPMLNKSDTDADAVVFGSAVLSGWLTFAIWLIRDSFA